MKFRTSADAGVSKARSRTTLVRRLSIRAIILAAATSAFLWAPVAVGAAQNQNLSLRDLETDLVDSPALAAADTRIFGADQTVKAEFERGRGFNYFFDTEFGPRSDIVQGTSTNRTVRYGQLFGVEFPLFGTRLTEHLALAQAQSQANVARIDAEGERRKLLGRLRESYINFWRYDREQAVIANFVALDKVDVSSARAFVREGFWTQANYLGFLDELSRFQTDLNAARSARRSALAELRAILNNDVPDRTPEKPDLDSGCSPTLAEAVSVATSNDAEVARLQELQSEAAASLDFIRHSSITANFRFGVGTIIDIPQRVTGYNVSGSFGILLPQHMRPEESARRQAVFADIQTNHYLELQRRSEIRASLMNVLDAADSARGEYQQAKREQTANREMLREARVRWATIIASGATTFNEVQARVLDAYNAERKETTDLAATFISVNAIENLVPNACVPFRIDGPVVKR